MAALAMACGGAVQVELLEDDVARVVPLEGGPACTLERARLPRGVREGDVVEDGQVRPEARERLAREVAALRQRLAVTLPDGLDLDAGRNGPLTHEKER